MNPKFLNGSLDDCSRYIPSDEESMKMKCGDFTASSNNQDRPLASRVHRSPLRERPITSNRQISMEENKSGGCIMDFSGTFTDGSGVNSKPPPRIGNKPKLGRRDPFSNKPVLGSSRASTRTNTTQSRNNGTPIVKMTRAMELRRDANKMKHNQNPITNSRTGRLSTIRESSFGKLPIR